MERGLKANHYWQTQLKASLSANDLRKKRKYNKIIFTLHSRSYYKFIKKTQYFETMLGCTFLEAFPLSMRLLYSFRTSKIHQMKLSFFEFTPGNNVVENNYQIKHLIERTLKIDYQWHLSPTFENSVGESPFLCIFLVTDFVHHSIYSSLLVQQEGMTIV